MKFRALTIASRALLVVGLLGATLTAHAQIISPSTTIPGFAGRDPYNTNCFTEIWGAALNNCGASQFWEIALPVSNNLNSAVSMAALVSFFSPSSTNLPSCLLYAVDNFGTSNGSVGIQALNQGNSANINGTTVPAGDSAYLWCTIPPGAKVYNVVFGTQNGRL